MKSGSRYTGKHVEDFGDRVRRKEQGASWSRYKKVCRISVPEYMLMFISKFKV